MRLLVFTTLYPNVERPVHGIFVENRLRHLLASGEVSAEVVAPVPWFPFAAPRFGDWAAYARVPAFERRHGLDVHHPRYPVIPKFGMTMAPALLYAAVKPFVTRLLERAGDIDAIDAHYFYPDGVAAVMLGRALGKPVVVTARGTDLNLIADHLLPRRQILWAARHAAGLVTVCQALKDRLVRLGVPAERIEVLRNGVDLEAFHPPADRAAARAELGLTAPTLLSVGHLIERKGHHLVIEALTDLPGVHLLIVGTGPERGALEALAQRLGLAGRVRFLGRVPHQALAEVYGAADALVLASSREGWANVLLEAMACGTPVVASDVWGTAEVVGDGMAGVLMAERSAAGVAAGVWRLFGAPPARAVVRAYAGRFSWDATTEGQLRLFGGILSPSATTPRPMMPRREGIPG